MSFLREKLKMPFLQMHDDLCQRLDRVATFAENWTYDVPLAMKFVIPVGTTDAAVSSKLYDLLEPHGITNVLVDTAGRRDLMHMRLTTHSVYTLGRHKRTEIRSLRDLNNAVGRISQWKKAGLQKLFFFVHQNAEQESPALTAHFIKRLNKTIGTKLPIPKTLRTTVFFDGLNLWLISHFPAPTLRHQQHFGPATGIFLRKEIRCRWKTSAGSCSRSNRA